MAIFNSHVKLPEGTADGCEIPHHLMVETLKMMGSAWIPPINWCRISHPSLEIRPEPKNFILSPDIF